MGGSHTALASPATADAVSSASRSRVPFGVLLACVALLTGLALPLPVIGESVLLGHVVLAGIVGLWGLALLVRGGVASSPASRAVLAAAAVMGLCVVAQALVGLPAPVRLMEEAPKYVLALVGAVALAEFLGRWMWGFLPLAVLTQAATVIYAWRTQPELFSYGGRFALEELGSSNSLAFVVAVIVMVLLVGGRSTMPRWLWLVRWPVMSVMTYVLLQSQSRGGLLALVVGVGIAILLGSPRAGGRRLGRTMSVLVSTVVACAGALYVASAAGLLDTLAARLDLTAQGASSGRIEIWQELVRQVLASDRALAFGYGPGSIQLVFPLKIVESGHSMFITTLYYFGVVGFVALLVCWVRLWRQSLRIRDAHAPLRLGLLGLYTFSMCVDNIMLSTQALLPAAITLAAVLVSPVDPRGTADPDRVAQDSGLRNTKK